jgi:hypothetical protein
MSDRARRPFWLHQAAEYLIGVAFVAQGLQSLTPVVPTTAGVAVLLNAALAKGPLAAFKGVRRSVHRVLDVVVMVAIVVAAVLPWDVDTMSRLLMVAMVVVLAFVWWFSDFTEPEVRRAQRAAARRAQGDRSVDVGRAAGRVVGNTVNALRRRQAKD